MSKHTYLFYDTETTGLNICFDQVLQFGAIRTDMNLNELAQTEIWVRLNEDIIPSPYALITHGISIHQTLDDDNELIAMEKIHQMMNTPNTISIGYNTLRFDDELLRFSFYRNLLSPYTHQYANGCSRMDLYPMAIMYYLYQNDALKWPIVNGQVSLKLDGLNALNQWVEGNAHDAITDIRATHALAKVFKKHHDMWHYLCGYFNKNTDAKRINQLQVSFSIDNHPFRQAIAVQGQLGSKYNFQAPVLSLGQHKHYKNQTLWLRLDNEELQKCSIDSPEKAFVLRKKMAEPPFILPMQTRFCEKIKAERLQLAEDNLQWLQSNQDVLMTIKAYYQNYQYPVVPNLDSDAALYEAGFPSRQLEQQMHQFHLAKPEFKSKVADQLDHAAYRNIATRIIGRHYPDYLSDEQQLRFHEYLASIYQQQGHAPIDYRQQSKLTRQTALADINTIRSGRELTGKQNKLLDELERHLS